MRYQKLKIIFTLLIIIFIFAFLFLILGRNNETKASPLDPFAQCLRDKDIVMYGAEWCQHCQNQKKMFGDAFKHINYVECPHDPQRCLAAGIEAYPTWLTANEEKLVGEQDLKVLSEHSNCPLPG